VFERVFGAGPARQWGLRSVVGVMSREVTETKAATEPGDRLVISPNWSQALGEGIEPEGLLRPLAWTQVAATYQPRGTWAAPWQRTNGGR